MKHLDALFQASLVEGALSTKHKELIVLGIAVATHCDPCILVHMEKAIASGSVRGGHSHGWRSCDGSRAAGTEIPGTTSFLATFGRRGTRCPGIRTHRRQTPRRSSSRCRRSERLKMSHKRTPKRREAGALAIVCRCEAYTLDQRSSFGGRFQGRVCRRVGIVLGDEDDVLTESPGQRRSPFVQLRPGVSARRLRSGDRCRRT